MENKVVRKAVIPAAGYGTRFLPATKSQPKEMLPIVDKPTLQSIITQIKQKKNEKFSSKTRKKVSKNLQV